MQRMVLKFGGTSVADIERIRHVAHLIRARMRPGLQLAVVTSAMAGVTNQYVAWADAVGTPNDGLGHRDDEYDVVTSSGEQVTAGLLAMALRHLGVRARSWLGWQLPVHTDDQHGRARIADVDCAGLIDGIADGTVAVVAGFQGITATGRVTTLGRGGGDTSAVALAAALKADQCDIYTDVDGVYTTDPRMVRQAQRLAHISYAEMLEFAAMGAKVLMPRAVELAMAHKVPVRVLSSFAPDGTGGTLICGEHPMMEQRIVSGIASTLDVCQLTLGHVPDQPGSAARLFGSLADAGVVTDMITESRSGNDLVDLSFTVARRDAERAAAVLAAAHPGPVRQKGDLARISVIGIGMQSHPDTPRTLFATLADKGINICGISTSEIKISVLVDAPYHELAVRSLHTAFGLDRA